MKRLNIATLFASLFLIGGLVSCSNSRTPTPTKETATIDYIQDENVNFSTDLDDLPALYEGLSGLLTVETLNGYTLDGAYQEVGETKEPLSLLYGQTNVFAFTLKAGKNYFGALITEPEIPAPTIKINAVDHVSVSTTLDKESLYEGQYGVLTVTSEPGYRVEEVKQNGTTILERKQNTLNDYEFFIEPGENVFDLKVIETSSLEDATIKVQETENLSYTLEFPSETYKAGDRGLIKFDMSKRIYVRNLKLNDEVINSLTFDEKVGEASYVLELKAGENTISYDTYSKKSTIKVIENPLVTSYEFSIDTTIEHDTYTKGTITVKCVDNNYVKRILQNGFIELPKYLSSRNVFEFQLLKGENTFSFETEEFHNEYGNNELIEGGNNRFEIDGTLSDDLDARPIPGGIPPKPLPSYPNGAEIYFLDSSWWQGADVTTTIICYDADKNPINSKNTLGEAMRHLEYNKEFNCNWWKFIVDKDTTKFVQFIRTGDTGYTDWNARTDILPVPDFNETNAYALSPEVQWYKDNMGAGPVLGFASAKLVDKATHVPELPKGHGIYTVYINPSNKWHEASGKNYGVNIYLFGFKNQKWPGVAMTREGNFFKYEIDTSLYQNMVFALTKSGSVYNDTQTVDIAIPFEEFGRDATILATLGELDGKKNTCTLSAYTPAA